MVRQTAIVLAFAVVVWAWCGALIGIGRQFLGMNDALIIHAVGASVGAAIAARIYFRHYAFTGPVLTAAIFLGTALVLDFLIVALLLERSLGMFASPMGVWIPLGLIFFAAHAMGRLRGAAPQA